MNIIIIDIYIYIYIVNNAAACTTSAKVWNHEVRNKFQNLQTDQPQERKSSSSTPTRSTPSIWLRRRWSTQRLTKAAQHETTILHYTARRVHAAAMIEPELGPLRLMQISSFTLMLSRISCWFVQISFACQPNWGCHLYLYLYFFRTACFAAWKSFAFGSAVCWAMLRSNVIQYGSHWTLQKPSLNMYYWLNQLNTVSLKKKHTR